MYILATYFAYIFCPWSGHLPNVAKFKSINILPVYNYKRRNKKMDRISPQFLCQPGKFVTATLKKYLKAVFSTDRSDRIKKTGKCSNENKK